MQINRNMSAVITNNQLLRTENKLAASMERLSSGLKINHASDNPAGIAISNKMKAQIDALDQAESNASDAVSVLQIADGALNEVSSIIHRMRELSVQAANDTNNYEDKQSIQGEIAELKKEVDRISKDTEYNTKTLLDGSSDVRVYGKNASRFQVSDTVPAQDYKMEVKEAATAAEFVLNSAAPGVDGSFSINGVDVAVNKNMTDDEYLQSVRNAATEAGCSVDIKGADLVITSNYFGIDECIDVTMPKDLSAATGFDARNTGCVDNGDGAFVLNTVGKDAVVELPADRESAGFTATTTVDTTGNRVLITDNNGFSIDFLLDEGFTGDFDLEVTELGSMTIQVGGNEHQDMDVRIGEISSNSLYLDTIDVSVKKGADRALTTLDKALSSLSAVRSRIGAFQNRLEYASTSLSATEENMTAAYSGLLDTDMAEEMTEYTQQNILNQAAISVLSQANELPQQVLSLLQ